VLKCAFDIISAFLGLLFSSWLSALLMILITLDEGFPVLISQIRIGKYGKPFKSYKFRSMKRYALKQERLHQAKENDERVTAIGKFMRKTALDEIPQLINILRGEMSFVGPRPLLASEVEVFTKDNGSVDLNKIPGYEKRISVKPGLTGIAQVYARRDLARVNKFKYDLLYIRRQNFFLDIYLILLSFMITFSRNWEKRGIKLALLKDRKP
jgi:lipopolysaccharide/colanic/teichoic acid biosynthesis glycosyltransferase